MTIIIGTNNDLSIEVNKDAIEPNEYFKILKNKKGFIKQERLQAQLDVIAKYILKAKELGQKTLLEKLAFTYDVLIKEQILFNNDITKFVLDKDIKFFLDKVNNIRLIELARYQRFIPMANMQDIKQAKNLKIFDDFCVMFTDYTDQDYKTPEEAERVKRNRDPIVFGYFRNERTGIKHERFYLITDWEDEDCDLTFVQLMEKMEEKGIKNPEHVIDQDIPYINELVKSTLEEMNKPKADSFTNMKKGVPATIDKNKTIWERLQFWKR